MEELHLGLEGIYFNESKICLVDGVQGKLYYRGYSIEDLAEKSNFEEVCYLLLYGSLPRREELERFKEKMRKRRGLNEKTVELIFEGAGKEHAMSTLRTAFSSISAYENYDDDYERSISIISKISTIVAAIGRAMKKKEYVEPSSELDHAENFLYMLNGTYNKESAKVLDKMMILHAEHSSNASTFASLVSTSTLSDIYSSIVSAISTLKGPLHGGADEAALRMIYEIKSPENAEKYVEEALKDKKKIMGFGHRVYKTYDPRAKVIKSTLLGLLNSGDEEVKNLAAIALEVEKIMVNKLGKSHGIWPNVDFFSGPVYRSMDIPPELFTPIFAMSRSPGWCAHIIEYSANNKLIRPLEKYTGEIGLEYKSIDERG
ncbi:MAG: citrate/2-methylcitrate synthase [Candidatus Micrarchaeaceae archaeon]